MGILQNDVVEVQLSRGLVTIIDAEDLKIVSPYKWFATSCSRCSTAYAARKHCGKTVLLHRVILGAHYGIEVDHRNQDGLDNRRENLRLCTRSENNRNTRKRKEKGDSSKYKGVRKHNQGRPKSWEARIRVDNKCYSRCFETELKAALWYDSMAKELHGEFANLNFQQR